MRIIRHPKKKKLKGCVVALGTFDGVHRGHKQVVKSAVEHAKRIKAASLAITFDPHPQQFIVPKRGLKLLTTLEEREKLFCDLGIDGVVVINFNEKLRKLSYADFVKKYLVDKLGVKKVFIGFDYAFGKGRKGSVSHLEKLGKKYGFEVGVIPPISCSKKVIKSSVIRRMLAAADFHNVTRMLGHSYQITGKVIRGAGRGKGLGFPTANLELDLHKLIPAHGVYAGWVGKRKCVVNIGARPTFGAGKTMVEVHVLNFKGDLRNKRLKVELVKRLRDELQFSDVEKLKQRIRKDIRVVVSSG